MKSGIRPLSRQQSSSKQKSLLKPNGNESVKQHAKLRNLSNFANRLKVTTSKWARPKRASCSKTLLILMATAASSRTLWV
jgi:hypothetical protein